MTQPIRVPRISTSLRLAGMFLAALEPRFGLCFVICPGSMAFGGSFEFGMSLAEGLVVRGVISTAFKAGLDVVSDCGEFGALDSVLLELALGISSQLACSLLRPTRPHFILSPLEGPATLRMA